MTEKKEKKERKEKEKKEKEKEKKEKILAEPINKIVKAVAEEAGDAYRYCLFFLNTSLFFLQYGYQLDLHDLSRN